LYFLYCFGAVCTSCTVFPLHSWHMSLMYLDVNGNMSCWMIFSDHMYSLFCIHMAWWWAQTGGRNSSLLNKRIHKACWLSLEIIWLLWLTYQ
jgi:hypothetical protein